MTRESCAPVEIIEDFRATKRVSLRTVLDETESDAARLERGLAMLHAAYEVLAPLNRVADWRLDTRRAACSIDEVT